MNIRSLLAAIALPCSLCLAFSTTATPTLNAQVVMEGEMPKVLVINREFLKPGRTGSNHEKTEKLFVQAMTAAKATSYYFAMDSMSGPSRSLFLTGYASLAGWEADSKSVEKNTTLEAALDHAGLVDGEQQSGYDQGVFAYRDDLSLHTGPLTGIRYVEVTLFEVKPGHEHELEEMEKMYEGYMKNLPNQNWATFQAIYGVTQGSVYLVMTNYKSLADADQSFKDSGAFMKSLSAGEKKRMDELDSSCLISEQTNLFEINPKISYPPPSWIKAEPGFWKPKAAPAAAKPATTP
jgi:hypothetical protein